MALPLPPGSALWRIAAGPDGRVWIATLGHSPYWNGEKTVPNPAPIDGLLLFEDGQWTFFPLGQAGMPKQRVQKMACDWTGALWLSMDWETLCRFDGKTMDVFHTSNRGLPSHAEWGFDRGFVSGGSNFLLVLEWPGVYRFNGATWEYITARSNEFKIEAGGSVVTSAAVDSVGRTWVAVSDPDYTRFLRSDGEHWEEIARVPVGYNKYEARPMIVDKGGRLWVAWQQRLESQNMLGLWAFNPVTRQWNQYNSRNSSLPDHDIQSLALDQLGRVWIGTRDGISVFNSGESRCWTAVIPSVPSHPLRRKVSTRGWNREKFLRYKRVNTSATVDSARHIWTHSDFGVCVFSEMQRD